MTRLFDRLYKRNALGLHRADSPTAMLLGEAELAAELENMCDELDAALRRACAAEMVVAHLRTLHEAALVAISFADARKEERHA